MGLVTLVLVGIPLDLVLGWLPCHPDSEMNWEQPLSRGAWKRFWDCSVAASSVDVADSWPAIIWHEVQVVS